MSSVITRILSIPLLFALLAAAAPGLAADADLGVASAIIMNAGNGEILFEHNADAAIPPASLTKVLTMFVAFDCIATGRAKLTDQVSVSKDAVYAGGSRMNLSEGEVTTLDDLLKGMAISSGNDAATAVAEFLATDEEHFVRAMNAKAKILGMRHSVFKNPTGLPAEGQVTTARDMLILAHNYLRHYPEALAYHSQKALKYNNVWTTNKNKLLKSCEGVDGLKTGWVCASGYNIITTAKRGETRVIAVIMGAKTSRDRAQAAKRLIDSGFTALEEHRPVATILAENPVKAAATKKVAAKSAKKQRKSGGKAVAKAKAPQSKNKTVETTADKKKPKDQVFGG